VLVKRACRPILFVSAQIFISIESSSLHALRASELSTTNNWSLARLSLTSPANTTNLFRAIYSSRLMFLPKRPYSAAFKSAKVAVMLRSSSSTTPISSATLSFWESSSSSAWSFVTS
jgi:hypothetical protein